VGIVMNRLPEAGMLSLLKLITVFVMAAWLTGCAGPSAAIIGLSADPDLQPPIPGLVQEEIYILTARDLSDDPALLFSGDRSPTLNMAKVRVTIPPNHEVGQIERARTLPPDPRTDFTIVDPVVFPNQYGFVAELRGDLRERPRGKRDILLFVHGFNTTLTDAVLRTAQFAHDTGFTGIPVVFSWASRGKTFDYVYDLNSSLIARDQLIEATEALLEASPAGVDLVAHSMGNLLTMEAVRQSALLGKLNASRKIRNVILASPDIDIDLFEAQLKSIPRSKGDVYVLISENDKALGISRFLAGGVSRVGDADPERLADLGVTVVDLSQVKDTSSIHHTKFAEVPEVVQLIGARLEANGNFETSSTQPNRPAQVIQGIANVPIAIFGGRTRSAGLP
jgi:esterase/lipase superfamily enzyme